MCPRSNRARSGCRSIRAISPRCSARRSWRATTRPANRSPTGRATCRCRRAWRPWASKGLWFDTDMFGTVLAPSGAGAAAALPQGAQGIGNSAPRGDFVLYPAGHRPGLLQFSAVGRALGSVVRHAVNTGTIGLLEPGSRQRARAEHAGERIPGAAGHLSPDDRHRHAGPGDDHRARWAAGAVRRRRTLARCRRGDGDQPAEPARPLCRLRLQRATPTRTPTRPTRRRSGTRRTIPTSSPRPIASGTTLAAPGSPFLFAVDQLFVDAALRGVTVLTSAGDGGSGGWTGDGVTNVVTSRGSPYDLMVGGTSLSTLAAAGADPTLVDDPDVGDGGRSGDDLGSGRRRPRRPCPRRQGPARISSKPSGTPMRSNGTTFDEKRISRKSCRRRRRRFQPCRPVLPERISASCRRPPTRRHWWAAACRTFPPTPAATSSIDVPQARRWTGLHGGGGTSASAPLWAALVSQFNAIFHDQGLPSLGYMNDLLYIAAAIAPGSFNDVTLGNNVSSFALGGAYSDAETGTAITPTGYGYSGRSGLRPHDGTGLAQRPAAGAGAHRHRPFRRCGSARFPM